MSSVSVSTKLERIAKLAREAPDMVLTTLAHHIDEDWMREAYRRTRKDGATGVDGQTAKEYEAKLEENLRNLLGQAKSGTYRAPPVRRVYIPKGTKGDTRPIGIPTFEDKVLQRAVAMVLEAVYEQDFLDCSYAFRPKHSQHQALETLRNHIMNMRGGWILEVDIRKYFDTVNHKHLREFVSQRVRDGVLLRLLGKWLNAGVTEDGSTSYSEVGTPQGGVISPILSNVFLHHVLDVWFEKEIKPRLHGQAHMVRFADDVVIVFANEQDARRVKEVLPKRFGKYGLTVHPDKTRLAAFVRPPKRGPNQDGNTKATDETETFDMLGFTHYWSVSRKGNWVVKRKTAKDRLQRTIHKLGQWCREHMHDPVREQYQKLRAKLLGHDAYYGITGNIRALKQLRYAVRRVWKHWLNRRSNRGMTWERYAQLLERYPLPPARLVHSISLSRSKSMA